MSPRNQKQNKIKKKKKYNKFKKYQWGLVLIRWAGLLAFCFWSVLASHFILWSSEWLASIGTQNSDSVIDFPS